MKPFSRINSFPISETRWLAYVTAGAASALACANSAEAEIHYSGNVSVELTGNAQATLPLSNGASLVLENIFSGFHSTFGQHFHFLMKGVVSGSARAYFHSSGFNELSNLPQGENVSAGRFYSVAGNPGYGVLIHFWSDGPFAPPNGGIGRGFVGFRFNTGNGTQYGWARIKTETGSNYHVHDLIKDYAWGDVGDRIRTGQKSSAGNMVDTVTDSGSVGLLALGAAGLVAWRKRRAQARQ